MYKNFNLIESEKEQILKDHIKNGYKMPLKEEPMTSPYKVGQVLQGKRDTDGQMYSIKITNVGDGYVVAKIKGPGTYKEGNIDNPLDGKSGQFELNSNTPGLLAGNTWMGVFTIVNQNPHINVNEHVNNQEPLSEGKQALIKTFNKFTNSKLISEQPAQGQPAAQRPVAKPQQGGLPKGVNPNGKPNMELVQKINTLKEFLKAYLSNVEAYVSPTHKEYGIMVNNQITKNYTGNQNPKMFQTTFIKVMGGYYQASVLTFDMGSPGGVTIEAKGGGNTIVGDLFESRDLNELYQNLNKYTPEIYSRVQSVGFNPDLQINIYPQDITQKEYLHQIFSWFENKEQDIKVFESVYPDFKKNLWSAYEYVKYTTLNNEIKEMNTANGYSERKQKGERHQISLDYYKKEDVELKTLLGMNPAPTQPAAQQPAKPAAPAQKPLQEAKETLKNVYKKVLGLKE